MRYNENESTNVELNYDLTATEAEAQYDEQAKRLLGHKCILSHILVKTVEEFKGMKPREVEACIEGDPIIGRVPIEPGHTNQQKPADRSLLRGFNTEQSELHEGMVRFDIVFYVRTKDGLSQIMINIELQKSEPDEYDILNRAIFYVSRLISSQKGRDFTKSSYNDLRAVHSIWICLNMDECIWNHMHLTDEKLLGDYEWKGNLNLFHIVMIGLPKVVPEQDPQYDLHRLLTALFSMELTAKEKMDIIHNEYDIAADSGVGKEALIMCNLSQGILEKGIEQGLAQGLEQGLERGLEQGLERGYDSARNHMIRKLHGRGDSVEEIAEIVEMSVKAVEAIIENAN